MMRVRCVQIDTHTAVDTSKERTMPAYFENGVFTDAQPAWHGMGVVVDDETLTSERIFELVPELGSKVVRAPIIAPYEKDGEIEYSESQRWLANVREYDGRVLGVMSAKYKLFQNQEMMDFGDALVGAAEGSHWKTAGSIKDGSVVWGLLALPGEINIGGLESEAMRPFLFLTNSFDGTCTFSARTCWTRVVCWNTWNVAMREGRANAYTIRHTTNMQERVVDAQEALAMTFNLGAELQTLGDELIGHKLSTRAFGDFLARLVPLDVDAEKTKKDNVLATREDIRTIFRDSPTTGDAAGTKWGALQSVVEYTQRYANVKQTGESRMRKVMLDTPRLNTRAARILTEA